MWTVANNKSFLYLDRIKTLYADVGVKLLYLPPYSPDFNPVEEYFAELKAYIKKTWSAYEENTGQGFHAFLRRCVYYISAKQDSAEGHSDIQV
jgi:transposase